MAFVSSAPSHGLFIPRLAIGNDGTGRLTSYIRPFATEPRTGHLLAGNYIATKAWPDR